MISMRYGTLPLVRETGGLKDTVAGYWDAGEDANGFSFKDFDVNGLRTTVDLALNLWFEHHDVWEKLQQPTTKEELLQAVLNEFEVDEETASRDLDELLEKFAGLGILEN